MKQAIFIVVSLFTRISFELIVCTGALTETVTSNPAHNHKTKTSSKNLKNKDTIKEDELYSKYIENKTSYVRERSFIYIQQNMKNLHLNKVYKHTISGLVQPKIQKKPSEKLSPGLFIPNEIIQQKIPSKHRNNSQNPSYHVNIYKQNSNNHINQFNDTKNHNCCHRVPILLKEEKSPSLEYYKLKNNKIENQYKEKPPIVEYYKFKNNSNVNQTKVSNNWHTNYYINNWPTLPNIDKKKLTVVEYTTNSTDINDNKKYNNDWNIQGIHRKLFNPHILGINSSQGSLIDIHKNTMLPTFYLQRKSNMSPEHFNTHKVYEMPINEKKKNISLSSAVYARKVPNLELDFENVDEGKLLNYIKQLLVED